MSTLTERVSVQARQIHVGRALLAAFIAIFWVVGWAAGKVVLAFAFIGAGIKVGWQDARKANRGGPAR